jgi:hypothetical protein
MINDHGIENRSTSMIQYPVYYQKGSVCIKRETARSGKQVTVPEACRLNTFGFQLINTPDKMSFDAIVSDMQEVGFEVYEKYLIILHQFNQKQPAGFRDSHEFTPEFAGSTSTRIPGR